MRVMTSAAAPSVLSSRFWADLSTRDFAALQASGQAEQVVAVLPVAAVEQHGPHLPLSVDATLLQGVIDAALPHLGADVPALFLPPQNIGLSTEHENFAGTLTLSPATVIALWTELGACVARAGVKKLLLFNSHGGNVAVMDIVARELRQRHGLLVYSASWFSQPKAHRHALQAHQHVPAHALIVGAIAVSSGPGMLLPVETDTIDQTASSSAMPQAGGNTAIQKLRDHAAMSRPAALVGVDAMVLEVFWAVALMGKALGAMEFVAGLSAWGAASSGV
eukprot:gene33719-41601_t